MITVRLTDGLGNQLFQYACAYALAQTAVPPHSIILDTTEIDRPPQGQPKPPHVTYWLDQLNVPYQKQVSWPSHTTFWKAVKKLRRHLCYRCVSEKQIFRYDPSIFRVQGSRIYLQGWWQCHRYFDAYRNALLPLFTLKAPSPQATALIDQLHALPGQGIQSCAVHIRRGDYAATGQGIRREYFEAAILKLLSLLAPARVRFCIFSDDTPWVRQEYADFFAQNQLDVCYLSRLPGISDLEELFVMAACQHQIVSPSTFSWWAAWLNQEPCKQVIAPDHPHWGGREGDFWPTGWHLLPAIDETHYRQLQQKE